ncbi:MAG TPA: hypothetical protein EYQ43_11225 [Methyloprofundus sp.]|nr:hypothetical protein [Methyloprofundus sp.]HIL77389.1 hypothetical protein [Methylococcales bacterium]
MSPSQNKAAIQAHIPQWQASSLTQAGYCKIHNIKPHTFSYYKKQFVTPAERHEGKDRNILERGVAIFAKVCFGHPSPSKRQKLNATTNAFGALRTCHFATTIVNSALAS